MLVINYRKAQKQLNKKKVDEEKEIIKYNI